MDIMFILSPENRVYLNKIWMIDEYHVYMNTWNLWLVTFKIIVNYI